ncbi:MAG: PP2C family protein-serine/threonine phosphatase [Planctomycetota bacterium]
MARGTHRRSVSRNRTTEKFSDFARHRFERDAYWQYQTLDHRWICPYCLAAVRSPQTGRSAMLRAIERHLAQRCPKCAGGTGPYQPQEAIQERVRYENIAHLAMTEPAWQVFDHEGFWYSPASLQRVPSVRLRNRRFDNFTVQNMVAHLATCPHYRAGRLHGVAEVQSARDRGIRVSKLAKNIRRSLGYPHWRQLDAQDHWICPYCLDHVTAITVNHHSGIEHHVDGMAHHLLFRCSAFRPDRQELRTLEEIRAAAGTDAGPPEARPIAPTARPPIARPSEADSSERRAAASHGGIPIATPLPDSADAPVARPIGDTGVAEAVPLSFASGQAPVAKPASERPADPRPRASEPSPHAREATPVDEPPEDADSASRAALDAISWLNEGESSDSGGFNANLQAAGVLGWMDELDREAAPAKGGEEEGTDLLRARDIQQSMLRESPCLPGFTFATRYQSCSAVSGDFYEFIVLPDGCIGFAQGDVSGHGVQAGLIMSMAKKVLSIYARQSRSPAEVLSNLNDALVEDLGGRMFITMTYAILDPERRTITWSRAGHSPTIRYNTNTDELEELNPNGMVVGMKGGPLFARVLQEQVCEVASGDVFLVYTDGVTETMNRQQEEYGVERLKQTVRAHGQLELEQLLERVMDSIRSFGGTTEFQDDITLLALGVD